MRAYLRFLLRPMLRAVFAMLRPGGPWLLQPWTCRKHLSEPGVTVIGTAAPITIDPPDSGLPKEIARALAQVVQPFPPVAALAPLVRVAQMGCRVQARLTDGTPAQRPILLMIEPKSPLKNLYEDHCLCAEIVDPGAGGSRPPARA